MMILPEGGQEDCQHVEDHRQELQEQVEEEQDLLDVIMVLVVDKNYGDPNQESDQDYPGSGDQLPGLDLNIRMMTRRWG